jgi:hypothetical protein
MWIFFIFFSFMVKERRRGLEQESLVHLDGQKKENNTLSQCPWS